MHVFGLVTTQPSHAGDDAVESVLPSTAKVSLPAIRVLPTLIRVLLSTVRVLSVLVRVLSSTVRVPSVLVRVLLILQCRGQKRLSLRDVLIVEAIDLDVWIFTPAPRWALTVIFCDNDLE
jgi:hypothetical protein